MKPPVSIGFAAALTLAAGMSGAATDGAIAVSNQSRAAFQQPLPTLDDAARQHFREGAAIFRQPWLVAPSEAQTRFDGLGPISNRLSCIGCHVGNGRGEPPANETDVMRSMLVRLSVPGEGEHGAPKPDVTYGDQFQPDGVAGVPGEGIATLRWETIEEMLPDGTRVAMRKPEIVLRDLHYGALPAGTMTSARMTPPAFGLGLLEAVPDAELLRRADPNDANHDGIRGRVNRVWDVEAGRVAVGRFGHKANQPTVRQQVAAALSGDMGITSRTFPQASCTAAETACMNATDGGAPEISDEDFDALVFSVAVTAPPAPRGGEAAGEAVFTAAGCAACHAPSLNVGETALPGAAHAVIHPYTDLLLHDMGRGLADNRPDFEASGRDWRTAPLWGIGLAARVNEHPAYLHDGRARDLTEAVLWHGGEARKARDTFAALPAASRASLIRFLETL